MQHPLQLQPSHGLCILTAVTGSTQHSILTEWQIIIYFRAKYLRNGDDDGCSLQADSWSKSTAWSEGQQPSDTKSLFLK